MERENLGMENARSDVIVAKSDYKKFGITWNFTIIQSVVRNYSLPAALLEGGGTVSTVDDF